MGGDYGKFGDVTGAGKVDDYVLPFQLDASGARGRFIRLGPVVDEILGRHDYPERVLLLLGEAVTLTAMLGASLKFNGKFILQTQSNGAVSFMVVHYRSPGHVRGYASYNRDDLDASMNGEGSKPLLGEGHLAMTIDPGAGMERYQGIVGLAGKTLTDAAHEYFDQSEQIPTLIRIAIARHFTAGDGARPGHWAWRAGGLMVQKLSREGGRQASDDTSQPDAAASTTTAGGAPKRLPRRSKIMNCSIQRFLPIGFFTGFSMRKRCAPSRPRPLMHNAIARASGLRPC